MLPTFSDIVVDFLKHSNSFREKYILITPVWDYNDSSQDAIILNPLSDTNLQFRISRNLWDMCNEFRLNDSGVNTFYYRVDMNSKEPIRISKNCLSIISCSDYPRDNLQAFANYVYPLFIEMISHHVNDINNRKNYISQTLEK
jgi:hypothetical protein